MEVDADPKVKTFKRRVQKKLLKSGQPVFPSQPLTISSPPTNPTPPPPATTDPTPPLIVEQPPPPPSQPEAQPPSTSQPVAQPPSPSTTSLSLYPLKFFDLFDNLLKELQIKYNMMKQFNEARFRMGLPDLCRHTIHWLRNGLLGGTVSVDTQSSCVDTTGHFFLHYLLDAWAVSTPLKLCRHN
ncbi:hypothetical protein Taro_042001 [Colocasia esculenta]|uniref:Uncharacterized protein n=1 Tax=Colocasia esculenta TaxID=4460 RepID=A0A843WXE7_COLES|nr:hypothetical protein [Colocasia esculenta]